jgi:hypothetical protein
LFLVAEVNSKAIEVLIIMVESEIQIYQIKEYDFTHDFWIELEYRRGGIAQQMLQQTNCHF